MSWRARLGAIAARIGLSGAAIAVLAALLAVQTVRLEGVRLWPVSIAGWKPRARAAEAQLRQVPDAQAEARRRAELARAETEQAYREIAHRTDQETDDALPPAMAAAERHIADNRVRCPSAGDPTGRADPAAGDRGAGDGDPAGAPAELDAAGGAVADRDARVAVAPEDVRICTENTVRLEGARAWGLALEESSAARQAQGDRGAAPSSSDAPGR
ncbi:MAG TPA: hypothetical protein VEB68_03510 [Croceibacterium sp.]|nr:hypothetical protein [Croceibacterium sp.]